MPRSPLVRESVVWSYQHAHISSTALSVQTQHVAAVSALPRHSLQKVHFLYQIVAYNNFAAERADKPAYDVRIASACRLSSVWLPRRVKICAATVNT